MSFLSPSRHGMPTSPTPDQPGGSILLNGPGGRPHSSSISSIPSSASGSISAYVPGPTATAAQYSPTASQSSLMSESALTDVSGTGSSTSTSTKIRFAPLPQVPPDLKRRSSITLGVLARRNMLQGQGTVGGGAGGGLSGTTRVVKMTDAEWEEYKRKFDQNKSGKEAVDLGVLAKQGAKSLWRKVRSSSTSSQSSTTSSNNGPTSPSIGGGSGPPSSPIRHLNNIGTNNNNNNNNGFVGRARRGSDLAILEEEESPTPIPETTSSLGLDTFTYSRQDYGAWNPDDWKPPHAHVQPRLLNEESGQGQEVDGDVTPRRRASPPPPPHPSVRQVQEEVEEEEEEEEEEQGEREGEEEEEESESGKEERQTETEKKQMEEGEERHPHPHGQFRNVIEAEGDVQAEHERDRREAVLGFDDERYHLDAQGHWEGHLE